MIIGRVRITARGWPWQRAAYWESVADKTHEQRYGWNPFNVKGVGRFGGGWALKIGVAMSCNLRDVVIDCGIGSIRVTMR